MVFGCFWYFLEKVGPSTVYIRLANLRIIPYDLGAAGGEGSGCFMIFLIVRLIWVAVKNLKLSYHIMGIQ